MVTLLMGGGPPPLYQIKNSARFPRSRSCHLTRNFTAGNQQNWTFAAWIKRLSLDVSGGSVLFGSWNGANNNASQFGTAAGYHSSPANDVVQLDLQTGSARVYTGNAVGSIADTTNWHHITAALDTTAGVPFVKMYLDGALQGLYEYQNSLTTGAVSTINAAQQHFIGRLSGTYTDTIFADVHFIGGQALTPAAFGFTFRDGSFRAKKYTGPFGTNGFKLEFQDQNNLGLDTSGMGNHWTSAGLLTTDQLTDTPTAGKPIY